MDFLVGFLLGLAAGDSKPSAPVDPTVELVLSGVLVLFAVLLSVSMLRGFRRGL